MNAPVEGISLPEPLASSSATSSRWERLDAWLERLSDRMNPIVVKDARQALKSRQFVITFAAVLICAAVWTVAGVALNVPDIYYAPMGHVLASGYYLILSVPMLLVVPFVAYRSLAVEREDGTYELLSITTLRAWQIALGKLASAVLQMMVYYSALTPCIAFTYLLKGIDLITLSLFLGYLFLASLLLSSLGILLGTVARTRHTQSLISVISVTGLVLLLCFWTVSSVSIFEDLLRSAPYNEPMFWMVNLAIVMFAMSFVVLFLTLAAGQLSFVTDNRSTPVRWVLVAQTLLWFGWMTYGQVANNNAYAKAGFSLVSATIVLIYWWLMGAFLVGERGELSPRVRRQLPRSFLGRMSLTWFNPGSGTGYVFTLLNMGLFLTCFLLLPEIMPLTNTPGVSPMSGKVLAFTDLIPFYVVAWSYVALYLGVGRLLVLLAKQRVPSTVWFSFFLQIVLVVFGCLGPMVIHNTMFATYEFDYKFIELTNPFWTLGQLSYETWRDRSLSVVSFGLINLSADLQISVLVVCVAGCVVFALNFVMAAREIHQGRQAAPARVQADDAVKQAALHPPRKRNPWDNDSEPTPAPPTASE